MYKVVGTKIYLKPILFLMSLTGFVTTIAMFPGEAYSQTKTELPVYHAVKIQPQGQISAKSFVGFVTPIHDVEIFPYINGFIDKINVKGGQKVQAGDTLLIIKQDEYKAHLDNAKAKVLQARADFNNADIYYKRIKHAGAQAVSKTEIDNAKARYLSAQAELSQAKAAQELAQVNFDYTIIKAPVSGVVGNVSLTKGDYVSPASASLLKIIQYDPIRVVFSITDKDYLLMQKSDVLQDSKLKLKLADGSEFKHHGQFSFTDNEINRSTGSLSVYADFANPDRRLLANAYVDVMLEQNYADSLLLPQTSVMIEPAGNYVYAVYDGKMHKQAVDILTSSGSNYVIKNIFAPDTAIITDKVTNFAAGNKVKISLQRQLPLNEEKP